MPNEEVIVNGHLPQKLDVSNLDESHKEKNLNDLSTTSGSDAAIITDDADAKSPWKSLWLSNIIQLICGVQYSVYFTSMWPYLSGLDPGVTLDFFGWVVVSYSVGQALSSPLFGWWGQRWRTTRAPASCGMILMGVGNVVYALLPILDSNVRWYMMATRFVVGVGSGTLGVLRAYVAAASLPKDRSRAVALGIACYVTGLSGGPAVQALFGPIGHEGFKIWRIEVNMYTAPALLMILLSVVSVILLYVIFEERFAGLMSEEQKQDPYTVLPKFDIIPAGICIYLWFVQCSVSTTQEVMASPYTIALYNWNDGQAVLYNGIIQSACAAISVVNYAGIAYTRIGRIDNRKMMLAGLVMFLIYHIISVPWPFYPGPLDYLNKTGTMVDESTEDHGGCYASYTWCEHSHRIPLIIYLFCNVIIFGFAYPYLATPNGTIFSHVLGPRRQEKMQGLFIFFGSVAQIVSPIFSTNMFEHFGYLWAMLAEGIFLTIGIALVLIYYRRLVPLKLLPPPGVAARYKAGLFYRL